MASPSLPGLRHRLPPLLLLCRRLTNAPTTAFEESLTARSALALLRSEKDPTRILSICRAAALSPTSYPDRAALSLAVSALSASGSQSSVRSLLDGLLLSPSAAAVRPHVIVLFGQAGMLSDALRVFEASHTPSVRTFNSLLFACILSKKHSEVPRIFYDFTISYQIKPDLTTYNTVIKAFCQSGSSRCFFSVLAEMKRFRVKPNATTFGTALAGFYREQLFDDVRKILLLMKKHKCRANLSIYNVRIQSLCKLKRSNEAKELLREMRKKCMEPDWVTYDHLILGCCGEGNLKEAMMYFNEMKKRGLVPKSTCYFTLIYYLCKGKDFEVALEVCKESIGKNWVPHFSIMVELVNGLIIVSKLEEAREMLEKLKEKFPSNCEMWKDVEEKLALVTH
ncbi:pentatricopeptide repeat-containing protein At1g61870, mitochondrial-like [Zingiber officinale]|uniref:Pentatricopeptide repeat-containing protein n=1 Tax=Zingiber officinale TaxID=94328 RepID=A0A8J5GUE1_ZINOF|nr:pentatricopeptide repeat-containing protein At1g61870, mitochondrial-like [Zingiber officinale]KAG6515242.1 hypothetical protein ZIOFF_025627 [Zingiber officinale]